MKKYDDKQFGKRLSQLITERNLTNKVVADKLNVSQQAVGNMIKTNKCKYEHARELAELFDVNWVWLRYGKKAYTDTVKDVNDERHTKRRQHLLLLQQIAELQNKYYHLLWLLEELPIAIWQLNHNSEFIFIEGHGLDLLNTKTKPATGKTLQAVFGKNETIMGMHKTTHGLEQAKSLVKIGNSTWFAVTAPIIDKGQYTGSISIAVLYE